MTARAIWNATLDLGAVQIPVKLYSAVQSRGVHFRLLHAADRVPVRQQMVDPQAEREVPGREVQWGLEVEEGRMVLLSPEELEAAEPEASRAIEVVRFVPRAAIDVAWYRRPYFLGPDGSAADCAALAEALRESGRLGIARWVMRKERYFGALGARDGQLELLALHDAAEVVPAAELARPAAPAASKQERELARQLVEALEGPFDPAELKDEYRERVLELVAAKQRGRSFRVKEPLPRRASGDLGEVLRRSIRAAKGRRRAAA